VEAIAISDASNRFLLICLVQRSPPGRDLRHQAGAWKLPVAGDTNWVDTTYD